MQLPIAVKSFVVREIYSAADGVGYPRSGCRTSPILPDAEVSVQSAEIQDRLTPLGPSLMYL